MYHSFLYLGELIVLKGWQYGCLCNKTGCFRMVTLFAVATLTFLMYLVPGGPFLAEKAPSPQTLKALEQKYGLDDR